MRTGLIVLLGLGVVAGYGSALGHMRHRWHGDCGDRWSEGRWGHRGFERGEAAAARAPVPPPVPAVAAPPPAAPAVTPQIIIVQPQAAAPAVAQPAPTIIVQPPAASPGVVPIAPRAEQGTARPQAAE